MRQTLIAGNWKMNLTRQASVHLARAVAERAGETGAELAVCPPFVYLDAVARELEGSPVLLGAQNVHSEPDGAFTGEISCSMLLDVGCRLVILGHSERRHILGESSRQVNAKLHAALGAGLAPIVCVGETLQERQAGRTAAVVKEQFVESFAEVSPEQMVRCVIAYEPVWAIGTGHTATPEQAEEVHTDLRRLLENYYNTQVAGQVRIQYGGSVKPENARELLSQPNIDGALVGGASLKADSFLGIAGEA